MQYTIILILLSTFSVRGRCIGSLLFNRLATLQPVCQRTLKSLCNFLPPGKYGLLALHSLVIQLNPLSVLTTLTDALFYVVLPKLLMF